MKELISDYIKHLGDSKSKNTLENYEVDLKAFGEYMDIKSIANITEVTSERIDDYKKYMEHEARSGKGYASNTRRRRIQSLRYFLDYLVKKNYIIENPAKDTTLPQVGERNPVYLELKEARRLVMATNKESDDFLRLRDRLILLILLNNGLRAEELELIKTTDIKDNVLKIIGKGNKQRQLILNDDVLMALKDYLKVRPKVTEYLLVSKQNKPMAKRTIQYTVTKYLKLAKLDPKVYSIHKLRHTAATQLLELDDITLSDVQSMLGHTDIKTSQIYIHNTIGRKIKVAKKTNGLYT